MFDNADEIIFLNKKIINYFFYKELPKNIK
jgi:hypothetical protein